MNLVASSSPDGGVRVGDAVAIPQNLASALDPHWLESVLKPRSAGTRLSSVDADVRHGVATHVSLRVEFERGGHRLPPVRLFLKGGFEGAENAHLLAGGAFYREARFYRDLAPTLPVTVPRCHFAGPDPETLQGVLLLDDIEAAGGRFRHIGGAMSVEDARQVLDQLAALHAATWGRSNHPALAWLPELEELSARLFTPHSIPRMTEHLARGRSAALPVSIANPGRIKAGLERLMTEGPDPREAGLLHGDAHGGNLYRTADDAAGLLDWQTVQRGCWSHDVAYFLCSCLTVEDRRSHGRELLFYYLEQLRVRGVAAPTRERALQAFARAVAYGVFVWALVRDTIVDEPTCAVLLERHGVAAADLRTYDTLGV